MDRKVFFPLPSRSLMVATVRAYVFICLDLRRTYSSLTNFREKLSFFDFLDAVLHMCVRTIILYRRHLFSSTAPKFVHEQYIAILAHNHVLNMMLPTTGTTTLHGHKRNGHFSIKSAYNFILSLLIMHWCYMICQMFFGETFGEEPLFIQSQRTTRTTTS